MSEESLLQRIILKTMTKFISNMLKVIVACFLIEDGCSFFYQQSKNKKSVILAKCFSIRSYLAFQNIQVEMLIF